jgi:hypothetical protein
MRKVLALVCFAIAALVAVPLAAADQNVGPPVSAAGIASYDYCIGFTGVIDGIDNTSYFVFVGLNDGIATFTLNDVAMTGFSGDFNLWEGGETPFVYIGDRVAVLFGDESEGMRLWRRNVATRSDYTASAAAHRGAALFINGQLRV